MARLDRLGLPEACKKEVWERWKAEESISDIARALEKPPGSIQGYSRPPAVGKIADEILSHLSTLPGARLRVSDEIEAEIPDGTPQDVQRTVSENAGVLKFDSHGFERE